MGISMYMFNMNTLPHLQVLTLGLAQDFGHGSLCTRGEPRALHGWLQALSRARGIPRNSSGCLPWTSLLGWT